VAAIRRIPGKPGYLFPAGEQFARPGQHEQEFVDDLLMAAGSPTSWSAPVRRWSGMAHTSAGPATRAEFTPEPRSHSRLRPCRARNPNASWWTRASLRASSSTELAWRRRTNGENHGAATFGRRTFRLATGAAVAAPGPPGIRRGSMADGSAMYTVQGRFVEPSTGASFARISTTVLLLSIRKYAILAERADQKKSARQIRAGWRLDMDELGDTAIDGLV